MTVSHNPEEASRRRLVLGALAFAGALLVGGAIVALAVSSARSHSAAEEPKRFTPAQETTAAPLPAVASSAPEAVSGPASPSAGATVTTPSGTRAPRIAFRLGATLYIAAEDGSGPVPVAKAAEGPFALSADGSTLAYISGGTLRLVDIASAKAIEAGPAIEARPAWSADSKSVYAVRTAGTGSEVFRVSARGGKVTRIASGGSVAVARDGDVVAIGPEDSASGNAAKQVLVVRKGRSPVAVPAPGAVTGVGVSSTRIFVGTIDDSGSVSTWSMGIDGSAREALAVPAASDKPAPVQVLMVSPDGRWLVSSATGDDGYSRTITQRLGGTQSAPISLRRDTYPESFSADGKWLYFIEGNAWQGEQTALKRCRLDGMGRVLVVSGAEP